MNTKNQQLTITCPVNRTEILQNLKRLKHEHQINISAYCADAIEQKLLTDNRVRGSEK